MNGLKTSLVIAFIASLFLLGGCGDLFQKNVKDSSLDSNKFNANCELNVDEFSKILEEPIQEAIDCLGKNLKLFVKAVESKKAGYLSRVALENYIKRNRPDIEPEVLKALKSVFDINFLIYGDDPDFISEKNIDALVKFAKVFNEKASTNFKPIFMATEAIDYENFRVQRDQRIKPAALVISSALREIFNPSRNGKVHKLNLLKLMESFTTENNIGSIAKAKKLLFAKKIILGGEKDEITHLELANLVDNFSSFVLLALDGVRYKDIRLDQESMIHFLSSDVELLNSLIFNPNMGNRDFENFLTVQDAIDAAEVFAGGDKFQLAKYYDLLTEAKQVLMNGDPEMITGGDLKRLFNHGMNLLKTGTMFHRFWSTERVLLEARPGRPVTYDFKNLYDIFKSEKKRVDDFVRILKKYRFIRGENISSFYTDDYWRNPNGVYEIAIYEYVLTLVMKKFGCPNNNLGGKISCDAVAALNGVYMKKDHVVDLVTRLKKVLIEADLIYPGREAKTAETITLLGSLFQYQSDENKVFDVNEATEFVISLFTALDISSDVNDHFLKLVEDKKCEQDKFGRYSPECFRQNFFQGVCLNYPDQFPKLFESLGATIYEKDPVRPNVKKLVCRIPMDVANLAYLDRSVKAARTCNYYPDNQEEIFYSESDMVSIFLAMMHIETTILRWDNRNHNNLMDPAEVMDAYNIYAPALDGFLEDKPAIIKKLKKQIYQFMVKYEQVPNEKDFGSIWKFAKFLLSFNKEATANRKTIASLLVTISEQGAPSTFDCNLLRDPEHIPEDHDPTTFVAKSAFVENSQSFVLTRGDAGVAQEIARQDDTWIRSLLSFQTTEFP
jgi:hypothetical protein